MNIKPTTTITLHKVKCIKFRDLLQRIQGEGKTVCKEIASTEVTMLEVQGKCDDLAAFRNGDT